MPSDFCHRRVSFRTFRSEFIMALTSCRRSRYSPINRTASSPMSRPSKGSGDVVENPTQPEFSEPSDTHKSALERGNRYFGSDSTAHASKTLIGKAPSPLRTSPSEGTLTLFSLHQQDEGRGNRQPVPAILQRVGQECRHYWPAQLQRPSDHGLLGHACRRRPRLEHADPSRR
jgi:hypothetical protein